MSRLHETSQKDVTVSSGEVLIIHKGRHGVRRKAQMSCLKLRGIVAWA
jgi:hypothetical protein